MKYRILYIPTGDFVEVLVPNKKFGSLSMYFLCALACQEEEIIKCGKHYQCKSCPWDYRCKNENLYDIIELEE